MSLDQFYVNSIWMFLVNFNIFISTSILYYLKIKIYLRKTANHFKDKGYNY